MAEQFSNAPAPSREEFEALADQIGNLVKIATGSFQINSSDGTTGQKQVTLDTNLTGKTIIGVRFASGSIANLTGLQLTLLYQSATTCYINYYKSSTPSGSSNDVSIRIAYI